MEAEAATVQGLAESLPAVVDQVLDDLRAEHGILVGFGERLEDSLAARQHVEAVPDLVLAGSVVVDRFCPIPKGLAVESAQLHGVAVEGRLDGARVCVLVGPVVKRKVVIEQLRVQQTRHFRACREQSDEVPGEQAVEFEAILMSHYVLDHEGHRAQLTRVQCVVDGRPPVTIEEEQRVLRHLCELRLVVLLTE